MEKALAIGSLLVVTITYHIWTHSAIMISTCRLICLHARRYTVAMLRRQPSSDTVLEKKTRELRWKVVRNAAMAGSHFVFGGLVITLLVFLTSSIPKDHTGSQAVDTFIGVGTMGIVFYFCCDIVTFDRISLSGWCIDAFFAVWQMSIILRVACMYNDPAYFTLGPNRAMIRLITAVLYMDFRKALFWNLIISLVVCVKSKHNVSLLSDASFANTAIWVEVTVFLGICCFCWCTRWIFKVCLVAQLQAEDAHNAVHRLLTVLCDAVVRVDAHGKMITPTPHFLHLLDLGSNVKLEGQNFAEYLASESDQIAIERVFKAGANVELLPTALHVSLRPISETPLSVQLLFAMLPDPHGESGYLIGIREMPQMVREAEVDYPETSSSASEGSPSSSSSQSAIQQRVDLDEIRSIKLKFDVLHACFALQQCSIDFAGDPSCTGSIFSNGCLPSLQGWIHPRMWKDLVNWAQESINAIAFNTERPPNFGPLFLCWPSPSRVPVHLLAQSVQLSTDISYDDVLDATETEDAAEALVGSTSSAVSDGGNSKCIATLELQGLTQLTGYTELSLDMSLN